MHCVQNSCISSTYLNKTAAGFVCIAAVTLLALSIIGLVASASGPFQAIVQFGAMNHGILLGASLFVLGLDLVWMATLYKKTQPSNGAKAEPSPLTSLPDELMLNVFSHLKEKDLRTSSSVCKNWKRVANDETLWKSLYPMIAFGKEKWATYFGDVGEEPPLPPNIHQILKSRPSFLNGKSIEETHWLVLIPKTVNGKPLTLRHMGELSKSPLHGHPTMRGHRRFYPRIESKYWDKPIEASYWALMSKKTLRGSLLKDSYSEQEEFIKKCAEELQMEYQIPYALEAAVCMFAEFVSSGNNVYIKGSTRCQDRFDGAQLKVGYLHVGGLEIVSSKESAGGVAGVLRIY